MLTHLSPQPDPISYNDNATKILLAIQESDTVLLRHCFADNNTQTYHLDPEQALDEETESVSFTDEEYGDEIVTRTDLNLATLVGHKVILPPDNSLGERTILCYEWHPHPIDN